MCYALRWDIELHKYVYADDVPMPEWSDEEIDAYLARYGIGACDDDT